MPGVTGVTTALVPLLAGSNWGSDVRVEGFQSRTRHRQQLALQRSRTGLLPHDGRAAASAGREFTRSGRRRLRRKSRSSTKRSPRSSISDATPSASASATDGRTATLDIEIVGLVQNAKYSEVKREVPPLFFRPYRQDDEVGSMTFYVRTAVRSDRHSSSTFRRSSPSSMPTCRSRICGRCRSRCRRTSSSIA